MPTNLFLLVSRVAAALLEDGATEAEGSPLHPAYLALAGLSFASLIVGLSTFFALGLDALLNLDLSVQPGLGLPSD